jgi:hypothetical protein
MRATAQLPDLPFDIAAVLLVRVISIIDEITLCLDLGHKAISSEIRCLVLNS